MNNVEKNAIYDLASKVRDARSSYYAMNGIAPDGGVAEKIGRADFGPLTVYVPNFPERIRTLQRHDLHHIIVGADTSMIGEAKVGAFECGAGLGFYTVSWFLEPQTIVYGIFLDSCGTYRAFKLGRRSSSLFQGPFREEWLEMTVSQLRASLLNAKQRSVSLDPFLFAAFLALGTVELIVSFITLPFTIVFYFLKKVGYG